MRDWQGSRVQLDALAVVCRYCRAPIGDPCMNEGRVLRAFPAHECRIREAKKSQEAAK